MAVTQEIESATIESYSPSPTVTANQTLSYFLSHNFSPDYMRNIMRGCHFTNTGERFGITNETTAFLSFAIHERPDQEAFAAFILRVMEHIEGPKETQYPDNPYRVNHTPLSDMEEEVTIISQPLPGESLPSALSVNIVRQRRRTPLITAITYHFIYKE